MDLVREMTALLRLEMLNLTMLLNVLCFFDLNNMTRLNGHPVPVNMNTFYDYLKTGNNEAES